MIKSLLKQNKFAQRIKAIKDLLLGKLDILIQTTEQQAGVSSLLLEEGHKTQHNTNRLLEQGNENTDSLNQLLENEALLLKFSVDIIKGFQQLNQNLQQNQQDLQQQQQNIYQAIEQIYQDSHQQQQAIYQAIERIHQSSHQQQQAIYQTFQKFYQENQEYFQTTQTTLNTLYTDIHNQKFKVITDPIYFQGVEIELMLYLYSFLPCHQAVDIGANRGDISLKLLEAGYEVYAFEPFPPVFSKLTERLAGYPKFHAFPYALGSTNETQDLHLAVDMTDDKIYDDETFYNSLTCHSLSEGLTFTKTIPVTVRTLADLHESGEIPTNIGLVKIDTEGFELEVIKGMKNFCYPVVVGEFWDKHFPFGQAGAMNSLPEMVRVMKKQNYAWHIVIYRIWGNHDVSYYCNSDYSIDNSWGNIFFFQDYTIFAEALKWCNSVMPATYFSA